MTKSVKKEVSGNKRRPRSRKGSETSVESPRSVSRSVGSINSSRVFNMATRTGAPFVWFKVCETYAGIIKGFGESNAYTATPSSAIDTTNTSPNDTLYAINPGAIHLKNEVWPEYQNIISLGVNSSLPTGIENAFYRYTCMVMSALTHLRFIINLFHLSSTYDWRKLAPGSFDVPNVLVTKAIAMGAFGSDLETTYGKYFRMLQSHILAPEVTNEIMRVTAPVITGSGDRVIVPVPALVSGLDSSAKTALTTHLDAVFAWLRVYGHQIHSYLTSFIHYALGSQPFLAPIRS
jgi:hypothetical protein